MSLCFMFLQSLRAPKNDLKNLFVFTVREMSHLKVHIQWSHDTDSNPVWFFSLCFPRFSVFMNIFGQVSQRTAVAFLGWFAVCCLKEEDVEKYLGHSGQRYRLNSCTISMWFFRSGKAGKFKWQWLQVSLVFRDCRGERTAARLLMVINLIWKKNSKTNALMFQCQLLLNNRCMKLTHRNLRWK